MSRSEGMETTARAEALGWEQACVVRSGKDAAAAAECVTGEQGRQGAGDFGDSPRLLEAKQRGDLTSLTFNRITLAVTLRVDCGDSTCRRPLQQSRWEVMVTWTRE